MTDTAPTSRTARRERTRAAILDAARRAFARNGYQKATIRMVAAEAGCDPALVMQHFGSKQDLFRAATHIDVDVATVLGAPGEDQVERVLRHTFDRMDANPEAVASTLRSMLTHDEVADEAFQLFNPPPGQPLAAGGDGPDGPAALGHQLLISLVLGTAINRYVLKAPAVAQASLADLITALRPAAELLQPPDRPQSS